MCILHVEVPDGTYTLVPADEDEEAGGDVHYVSVDQHPDQSPEVCVTACADEGKPQFNINLCAYFKLLNLSLLFCVHLHLGVELKP
jgi:hypothetical protein